MNLQHRNGVSARPSGVLSAAYKLNIRPADAICNPASVETPSAMPTFNGGLRHNDVKESVNSTPAISLPDVPRAIMPTNSLVLISKPSRGLGPL